MHLLREPPAGCSTAVPYFKRITSPFLCCRDRIATANATRADGSVGNAYPFRISANRRALEYTWKRQDGTWNRAGGGWRAGFAKLADAPQGHILRSVSAWNDNVLTVIVVSATDNSTWVVWQNRGSNNWSGGQAGVRVAQLQHFAR